jgi:fibronectin-binding autotransporter adhesin
MIWLSIDCRSASAAAYTWNPAGSTSTFGGGGTWDPSSSNWWNGTTTAVWSSGNDAWFTGPAAGGNVTLNAPQTVGNIVFSQTGYTLTGSTLTVSGGTVSANQNATINSSIADNGLGVTFTGSHVVTLGAAYDPGLTGPMTISSGTVVVNGTNPGRPAGLYSASSITINSGATLVANTNNSLFGYSSALGQINVYNPININQGGLLTTPNGNTTHLTSVQLGGGMLSAAQPNVADGSWALDGGVTTAGIGNTSYILGGNLCLSQNTGGGTPGATLFNVQSGDSLYVGAQLTNCSGFVSGTSQFGLFIPGGGTLTLAGSNNFTPATQMNSGTLVLANSAALSASPLVINGGNTIFSGVTQTFPLVSLSGNSGTLVLSNTNGTPVNLSVGSGNATTTYAGVLTGSGSLTLAGGHLTLGGYGNNYNATILAGGTLTLGTPSTIGTGTITMNGGTLQYTSAASGIADLSSQFNTTATNQKFTIDAGGLNLSYSGNLTGGNQTVLTKIGAGELTVTGSNNYGGGTNINGGTLQFASSSSVPPTINAISIGSGGVLVGSFTTVQGWLNSGKIKLASNGAIALTSSSTDTSIDFTNGAGGYPSLSLGVIGSVTYGGTIKPQGGYNLGGGGGTLLLTAALTGANSLNVGSAGNITVTLANSADNWTGPTTIAAGSTLLLGDGMVNSVFPVSSISNSGTLIIKNVLPETYAGGLSAPASANVYALGSSVLTLNGTNSAGVFYANGGTLNINGLFSTISKTVLGSNLSISSSSPTVVNWNATGSATGGSFFGVADTGKTATLNVNGGSLAIANVTVFIGNTNGGGVGTLNMSAGTVTVDGSHAFDIGDINNVNSSSVGVVNINGGLLSITSGTTNAALGGAGAVTMAFGSNSSATINLNGGVLSTGRSFVLGSGSAATINLNGGTLQATSNGNGNWFQGVTVVAGAGGAIIDTQGNTMTIASTATISGPGGLTKYGTGNLALNGTNTYQGITVVNGGLLSVVTEAGLGPVPSSFLANNVTLNGGELRDNSGSVTLSLSPNRGVFLGPNGGYLRCGFANTLPVNGVISGGKLTITDDTGAVYLANPGNTYTGSTTIGLGTPLGYSNGSANVNVQMLANGGQPSSIGQSTSAASNLVFSAPSNGTGKLNYVGSGDGTNRLFTIASGTAAIDSSGTGPMAFTNAGSIAFTGNAPVTLVLGGNYAGSTNTFAAAVANNGASLTSLDVNGSAWNLTGNSNTFTGGTTVAAGTLIASNIGALADGSNLYIGSDLSAFGGMPAPSLPGQAASPATSPVPEPGTFALAATLLCGAAICRRRCAALVIRF